MGTTVDLKTLRTAIGEKLCEESDRRMSRAIANGQIPADWTNAFVMLTEDEVEGLRAQRPEILIPGPNGHGYQGVLMNRLSTRG